MRKITFLAAFAAASALSAPAMAAEGEGHLQVKVMATGVLPDGKIDKIKSVLPSVATALGTSPGTKASNNVVPTIAIEYYATPNVSVETICCFTTHHVTGTGSVAGANLVKHVMILPATVTLKYHLDAGPIRPYIGAGPALFLVFDEKPGSTARALGVTDVKMSNSFGLALQGGVDVPLNPGMGISLDAKRYFMKPTAKFYAGNTLALETKHKLDPWVLSGGVYFRF
jgi:outer membrane protein